MAQIPVEFPVKEPKLDNTINKFKQLKQELRDAKGELAGLEQGTEAFARQAAKVGQINDKIKDLNSNVSAVSGEPIENLTNSFSLLGSQVATLDFKGATSSIKSISNAAGQIDFKTLTEGAKGFGKSLLDLSKTLLTSPIFILAAVIGGIVLAVQAWNENNKKIAESQKLVNEAVREAKERQNDYKKSIEETQDQIDVLEGKLTDSAAKIKKVERDRDNEREKRSNDYAKKILEIAEKLDIDLSKIQIKNGKVRAAYNESRNELYIRRALAFNNQVKQLEDEAQKEGVLIAQKYGKLREEVVAASNKKIRDELAKTTDEIKADPAKFDPFKDIRLDPDQETADAEKYFEYLKVKNDEVLEYQTIGQEYLVASAQKTEAEILKAKEEAAAKARMIAEQQAFNRTQIEENTLKSIQGLSDIFFAAKLSELDRGTAAYDEAARKQFNINKALSISTAVNNGALAVTSILAQYPKFDGGIAMIAALASSVITTAAQVAKIASSKYQSTVGNQGGINTQAFGQPITPAAPETPLLGPQTLIRGQQTQPQATRVYVLESDIKKATSRVNVLENRASF